MYAILIGASAESIHAIQQAKKLGLQVLAFDGNPNATGFKYADESFVLDIRTPENIYSVIEQKKINAEKMVALPVPIGMCLSTVGAFNEHYNLVGPYKRTADLCTDKWKFHQCLNAEGLRNVQSYLLKKGDEFFLPLKYPLIAKPRFGSGNRSVIKISSDSDWYEFRRNHKIEEDFIIDEFVSGEEFGIDGIVFKGNFFLVLARKKIITPPPYRQCVGYISTNNRRYGEFLQNVSSFISKLVKKIKLQDGVIHADIILTDDDFFVIEMSARPSGHQLHNIFTPYVTGIDMVFEFINYAIFGDEKKIQPKEQDSVFIIRYFDIESKIRKIPEESYLYERYPIKKYQCNLTVGEEKQIIDGASIMGRGFFILEARSEEEANALANNVLEEFLRD